MKRKVIGLRIMVGNSGYALHCQAPVDYACVELDLTPEQIEKFQEFDDYTSIGPVAGVFKEIPKPKPEEDEDLPF